MGLEDTVIICLFGLKPYKTMKNQIKIKTSKSAFEQLIVGIYGNKTLSRRKVVEEGTQLTLYYDEANPDVRIMGGKRFEFSKHIGTWQRSGAWYHDKEDNK